MISDPTARKLMLKYKEKYKRIREAAGATNETRLIASSLSTSSMRLFTPSPHPTSLLHTKQATTTIPSSSSLRLARRRRCPAPVRAGGPPSTNSLLLAFFLPLSLLLGTVFTAIRISDDLDEKYINEIEMNLAIMEENEMLNEGSFEENEGEDLEAAKLQELMTATKGEELAAATKARNRPRREI